MGFVANAANQQQRRAVDCQRDGVQPIAGEEQFLFLGDPRRNQATEAQFLERGVRRRELALAAVDQNQVGERPAVFEQLAIAAEDHLVHCSKVVEEVCASACGRTAERVFEPRRASERGWGPASTDKS